MSRNSIDMVTPDELFHWIPGEMLVIIRLHRKPAEETLDALVEQVRSQLNFLLARYKLSLEPYGSSGRWRGTPTMPPVRRRVFIFGLHRQQPLAAIFFHVRHADPAIKDAAPMALSYLQRHFEQLAQAGLYIVSAMPNWLVTAAPVYYGDGGPATPPRPAPKLDIPTSGSPPVGWQVSFMDAGLPLDPNGAEEVMVAVLDTAHYPDQLIRAAARPEYRRNFLLRRLASNLESDNGSFEIEYNRYPVTEDVRTGLDVYGEPRYYSMPDHGMFVTGLIRDIAPHARIRLIRILDDFGGCDLYNLFAALTDLQQELISGTIRRLVINLSCIVMPDIRRLPSIWLADQQWSSSQLAIVMRVLNNIEDGLRLLFESLYEQGALIVAAAGNDSTLANAEGQMPRPPRAPARYDSTLSVSAVNSRFEASRFANLARLPSQLAGVATFGGDIYGSTDGNSLPDAVRGIYISPTFPGGEQNITGWADWSGTSFATAIISGLGAHLMALGRSAPQAIARIAAGQERRTVNLFGSPPDVPHLLANLVKVQQRFGLAKDNF